ncbi:hypothetical protein BS17DRAFT_818684 [Gyrodon lividus]|nr:hypothetical protein BS17DRAFT_818684 [Gyrodon lividus]
MFSRQQYGGSSRKLVLAFDVGTTFSGVSYCILDPGEVPQIHGVPKSGATLRCRDSTSDNTSPRYPGQENVGGNNKIPSIVYYDKEGSLRAVGAETQQQHIIELAANEQWIRLEWWKLYLRAQHLEASHFTDADIPALPKGKSAVQVLGDFLGYLFKCAKAYITEAHTCVWESLENDIEFVLTHPNGWEGPQQQQIRNAAELGGLIAAGEEGQSHVHLLTEGEASLHFCVTNVLTSDTFSATPILCSDEPEEVEEPPEHQGVIIIDAGGGTIDLSAYSMKLSPTSFKEIAPAECRLQGSVFITYRAHAFLRAKLANSRYGSEESLYQMTEVFDKTTKLRFRDEKEPQYIKFGTVRDKDPEYDIRSGQLKLSGQEVSKLFEPSVQDIIVAFEQQRQAASMPITCVFLVGGFAASDWLYTSLMKHMSTLDVTFCRPSQHVNKAVADGAVSFFIDHLVSARAARFTYGTECNALYNEHEPEHVARESNAFQGITGCLELPNAFESILTKGTEVSEEQEFKKPFIIEEFDLSHCSSIQVDIVAYRGKLSHPCWVDTERGPLKMQEQLMKQALFYDLNSRCNTGINMLSRQPYEGLSRKLVLAFDVGTTYSGVSYCILDPGEVPKILGVSRYPAQEHVGGDNKIPSILYYDQQGNVRAIGAETSQPHIIEQAEEERWVKLEWWKLHLRAKHLSSSHIKDDDIPPLPQGKSAVQVLGDFMQYLFSCARTYIIESHANGASMWRSVENRIEFVLTHPNGWEGLQQQQIRRAAELARLIPSGDEHHARIHLLTEGEASLHFCVNNVLTSDSFSKIPIACPDEPEEDVEEPEHQGVVIIDAGGGTIDLSAYSMKLSPPRSFEEVAPAECRLQGSVFVTQRAHTFIKAKLANSRYGTPDIVQQMKDVFDTSTKLRFRDAGDPQYIKFGAVRDKDPQYDIRSGQLKLAGEDVARFFEPSVQEIAEAFEKQRRVVAIPIKHTFLVGGYAASDFLYRRLQKHPVFSDVHICRPASHVNKAVADGAVSFYIDHLVTSRTSRFTYGVECHPYFDPHLAEHRERDHMQYTDPSGHTLLPNGFQSILMKGTQVSEQQEFRRSFVVNRSSPSEFTSVETPILAYRGNIIDPTWMDTERASFTKLCTVIADTSKLINLMNPRPSLNDGVYYSMNIDVILLFGLTELRAQTGWEHMGVEMRSPASIMAQKSCRLSVDPYICVMRYLPMTLSCTTSTSLNGLSKLTAFAGRPLGRNLQIAVDCPYQGLSRKLILAFDVGTAYSGVSYCVLDPGEIPEILGVSSYPAQEHVGGDNKMPSILYYDQHGAVRAVGAEALQPHVIEQAEDEEWTKLEWWKLHLRAKHLAASHIKDDDIPPLPQGKDAVQVLGDFMRYLFTCGRNYIVETHANGANMWKSLEDRIEFLAGLVPDEEGQARIHLLTEGEASLHFCVTHVLASNSLSSAHIPCPEDPDEDLDNSDHQGVVIIDAGGGTVDLSAYSMKLSPPTSFEEIAPAECRLQGSVFVTHQAHAFLKAKLANSRFGAPAIVWQMRDEFDRTTKLRFRNAEEPQWIKFGTVHDKDRDYDIRSGQLKLAGEDVAEFFRPSVEGIAEAFEQQRMATTTRIKYVFLVGGYAASDFLYASLCQHPVFSDVNLCRPGNHVNKAVADGGVSFYIDHLVSSRAARFTYGVKCSTGYQSHNLEHAVRRATAYHTLTGRLVLPNAFRSILAKVRISLFLQID